jgi:hypothetical protein
MKRISLASTHNPICVENGREENTLTVVELHQLNSVKPIDFSWSFRLILRNDPLGLL